MKKNIFLMLAIALSIVGCLLPTAIQQPQTTNSPAPDLNATAEIFSQQTLDALPSETIEPTNTPQVMTITDTPTQATATETQNSILLTLTATLGTGTVTTNNKTPVFTGTPGTANVPITGTLPLTITPSATPYSFGPTPTGTPHPQYSGTMPPNLPFGIVELTNKSKADAYISMRCVTREGYVTIIEYPVKTSVSAKAPAGRYTYVVWVGGRKIDGSFSLSKNGDISITIYKDHVAVN